MSPLLHRDWSSAHRTAPLAGPEGPIGLFDSGVGGLTVLAALSRRLPAERALYIADQAHVPYGGRPLHEIRGFAGSLSDHLFEQGAKAVVMACNISSATAQPAVAAAYGEGRVFGMIGPGAKAALEVTRRGVIGVLATQGTVNSGAYGQTLAALAPEARSVEVPCPRFVPLVEAGDTDGDDALAAARAYLAPILEAGADTVILGCTHYPFLLATLERAAEGRVRFVDPAEAVAETVARALEAGGLLAPPPPAPDHALFTTASPPQLAAQLGRFAPGLRAQVAGLVWRDEGEAAA